jgi:hypothetical protein
MSRVGENEIRQDLYEEVLEKMPKGQSMETYEKASVLRRKELAQPEQRSVTTQVRNLSEFYDLFRKVMNAAAEVDGLAYTYSLVEEFPPSEEELPAFSCRLIERTPWADTKGRKELVPRYMETKADLDQPGSVTEIYFHRQTNIVEVTVWAKTNKVANLLSDWVEEKFFENLWAFQWSGIPQPIVFLGRAEDMKKEVKGQLIHGRPLRFLVNTGRITKRNMATLRKISLKLGFRSSYSDPGTREG